MGGKNSKAEESSKPSEPSASQPVPSPRQQQVADKKASAFIERIFSQSGNPKQLAAGEVLIEQGVASTSLFYIQEGSLDLVLRGEDGKDVPLATRGPGEVLGELSMLLGHKTAATAVAVGKVNVVEVEQSALLAQLVSQPTAAGMLFRVVATYLSERIAELSGLMRNNVVKAQAPAKQAKATFSATDISRARSTFGLAADAKLLGVYQCSVRSEVNGVREPNGHFGEMFIFENTLCFDLKMFAFHKQMKMEHADVLSLLKADEANLVELQSKGSSLELLIPEGFNEACLILEACRVRATVASIHREQSADVTSGREEKLTVDDFHHVVDPIVTHDKADGLHKSSILEEMGVKEEDWKTFLSVATQRTYQKGEYVLQEGQMTAKLFQVVRGSLRVELQLAGQGQAVVVGYRRAGEMLGETSLLKEGKATASLAADEPTTVVTIEGRALEQLFQTNPKLPSRFFCFLATYQAERLELLTQQFADAKKPDVTVPQSLRLSIAEVMGDAAYCGVLRKYLKKAAEDAAAASEGSKEMQLLHAFDFYVYAQDYKVLPDLDALKAEAATLNSRYISNRSSACILSFIDGSLSSKIMAEVDKLASGKMNTSAARLIFSEAQQCVLDYLSGNCFSDFLGSSHYRYILELKAKEKIVPSLNQFRVIRVMGEGGFGQVIDVVKRDCGCHYAMKVMQKEMMKQNLGSSWRKKIASEQQIMTQLHHPFMVNLKYSFQNSDFLILVMDLISSGDLSEFVLTKKRLAAEQVKWALMEVTEVMSYMHSQSILYRDLKPENLLIDDEGHIRLIDMGLAARFDPKAGRNSRVGTDCYMAPEVRFARRRRQAYGKSADWYTVGVLLYEFTHGALPFTGRDAETPIYRGGEFPTKACKALCEGMLAQDWKRRIGCGPSGDAEIKQHEYFEGVDWDIVAACKIPSPMKGVKGVPKKKKDKEMQAQRTAGEIADADKTEEEARHHQEYTIDSWNFVSPTVVSEEYMESVYQCVSAI